MYSGAPLWEKLEIAIFSKEEGRYAGVEIQKERKDAEFIYTQVLGV